MSTSKVTEKLNKPGLYNLTMFFQSGQGGWSERYPIGACEAANESVTVPSFSIARYFSMCCYRAALLGAGDKIIWARISLTGKLPDSLPVLSSEIPAMALEGEGGGIDEENSRNDALKFMLLDGNGHKASRIWRGMRDEEITANGWEEVADVMPLGTVDLTGLLNTGELRTFTTAAKAGAGDNTDAAWYFQNGNAAAAVTLPQAWSLWLQAVLQWTGYAQKIRRKGVSQTIGNYNFYKWAQDAAGVIFRGTTTKKCGAVFGRSRGAAVRSR